MERILTWLLWTWLLVQSQWDYWMCNAVAISHCANAILEDNVYSGMLIAQDLDILSGSSPDLTPWLLKKHWYDIQLSTVTKLKESQIRSILNKWYLLWFTPWERLWWRYIDKKWPVDHAICIVGYNEKWIVIVNSWGTKIGNKWYYFIKRKATKNMLFQTIQLWSK